jgi:beta-mannosidase
MKTLSLNGTWYFLGTAPQPSEQKDVCRPDPNSADWRPIPVPGDVNQALIELGKIPNPHYDTNARQCYWVTSKEWWYKLEFDLPAVIGGKIDLCFTGVDGPATLWLNDAYLGEMRNAFRLFRFDVTSLIKEKGNRILLRFKSIDQLLGGPRYDELAGWNRGSFLRKPQFSFGWDWALPLPSIGLSGNVWLEANNECRFVDLSVQPFMSGRVDFGFEVTGAAREQGYEIILSIAGHGAKSRHVISRKTHKSYLSLKIANPKLWFPNGYGDQPLYDYTVELIVGGTLADKQRGRFGLRESRIMERPFTPEAGPGFSFEIEVNGVPIFCKGSNWVPLELWPGNLKPEQYEFYLRKAKEANFNMIRVWGGGIYEPEIFYRLCDEMGLMVWQDFMFASSGYPVDLLRDEIAAEANYQIRRLRNHPCIVLWCGCNEDIYSWSYPGGPIMDAASLQEDSGVYSQSGGEHWKVDRLKADPQIYTMILRGLVGKFGLGVPYIESSPQSRDDYGNLPNSGNCHISCWKYALFHSPDKPELFRKHFEQVCSFDSEFCIQGPCGVQAFKKFMAPQNLWPPNEAWIFHIQKGHRKLPHHEQTLLLAGGVFGQIDNLPTYVKHGQALHAEMMRAEFESARRDRPNNGGTMFWMYNDCWPTANWSAIDYYRIPKPSYYAARRACVPFLPIIMERRGLLEFFMSNESAVPVKVEYAYGVCTLTGERSRRRTKRFTLPANSVSKVDALVKKKNELPRGSYWFAHVKINGCALPEVSYFPDGWKDMPWPMPKICVRKTAARKAGKTFTTTLRVSTDVFARFCHLAYSPSPEYPAASCVAEATQDKCHGVLHSDDKANAWCMDNFFDLPAGSFHTVEVESERPLDLKKIKIGHWLTEW